MPGERAAASKTSSKAKHAEPDPDPDPYSGPALTAASASADESGAFWAIRGILEEKKIKRRLHYKVDWENHPETGESYAPTWVSPKSHPDCLASRTLTLLFLGTGEERNPRGSRRVEGAEFMVLCRLDSPQQQACRCHPPPAPR